MTYVQAESCCSQSSVPLQAGESSSVRYGCRFTMSSPQMPSRKPSSSSKTSQLQMGIMLSMASTLRTTDICWWRLAVRRMLAFLARLGCSRCALWCCYRAPDRPFALDRCEYACGPALVAASVRNAATALCCLLPVPADRRTPLTLLR